MYENWGSLFQALPDDKAGQLIKAIYSYFENPEYEVSDPVLAAVFEMIKSTMQKDTQKYEETCEKRRMSALSKWYEEDMQDYADAETMMQMDANGCKCTDNDANANKSIQNGYDTSLSYSISLSDTPSEADIEVIEYMNKVCDKHYRTTKGNLKYIHGRFNDGYTVDDLKTVIDNKANDWKGDVKWDKFLRPQTLFAPEKFDSYLNEKPRAKPQDSKWGHIV